MEIHLTYYFWIALTFLNLLVVFQGVIAWRKGFFTHAQLYAQNIFNGESFIAHGGMWADFFIISPLTAYILTETSSTSSPLLFPLLFLAILTSIVLGYVYHQKGKINPHPHADANGTSLAGWAHNLYTILALWAILLLYTNPSLVSTHTFVSSSVLLSLFCILGVTRFNHRWHYSFQEILQISIELIVLWSLTMYHLL